MISNDTLKLVEDLKAARQHQQLQHVDTPHKKIRKKARKDKKNWLEDAFQQGATGTAKDQWAPVKNTRKRYLRSTLSSYGKDESTQSTPGPQY